MGPRIAPPLQQALGALDPGLARPVRRFRGERPPANEEIIGAYCDLGLSALVDESARGNKKRNLGSRTVKPTPAMALASTPIARWTAWRDHVLVQVTIESGITTIASFKPKAGIEFEALLDQHGGDRDARQRAHQELGWIIFGRYVDRMKHHPAFSRVRHLTIDPRTAGPLLDVCERLPMSPADRQNLIGDLAVLQHDAARGTALFEDVGSAERLLDLLTVRGYPRLADAPPQDDPHQRLDALVKSIAQDLDYAVVATVNFTNLFDQMTFEHQPKKRAP